MIQNKLYGRQLAFDILTNSIVEEPIRYWKKMDDVPEHIKDFILNTNSSRVIYDSTTKQYHCSKCLHYLDNQFYCSNCSKQCKRPINNNSKYIIHSNITDIKEYKECTRYFVFDIVDDQVLIYIFRVNTYYYNHQMLIPYQINSIDIEGSISDKLIMFYGNKAIGKTHLLNIIANGLKNKKSVLYITSEEFIKDVIDLNKRVNFLEKYSNTEVLIVDDIQYFAGNSMYEFEKLLNILLKNSKIVILSSNVALGDLKVSEQLKKTLDESFKVKIGMLDNRTKLNFVNEIINEELSLPEQKIFFDELKRYIADNSLDFRELKNMIYRIRAYIA